MMMSSLEESHKQGNEFFKANQYDKAIECYSYCINNSLRKTDIYVYTLNRSKSFYFLSQYERAMKDINRCINYFYHQTQRDYYYKSLITRANISFAMNKLKLCIKDCDKIIITKHNSFSIKKAIKSAKQLKSKTITQQYTINKSKQDTLINKLHKCKSHACDVEIANKLGFKIVSLEKYVLSK